MEENKFDKVLNALKQNQNNILLAGAAVGATALGYYGLKQMVSHTSLNENKQLKDEYFSESQVQPLYASEALIREKMLSNVSYELALNLEEKNSKTFSGRVKISFMVAEQANKDDIDKLFLDFHGKSVSDMHINEKTIPFTSIKFSKHRLMIPVDTLNINKMNHITLKFKNTYVDNSAGLHKYVDPVDKEVYIFSNLEPYYCNRWFPCFDQPSLRASLKLTVISPEQLWQVVSNGKKTQTLPLSNQSGLQLLEDLGCEEFSTYYDAGARTQALVHNFEETPHIGTYVFGLFCGRFKCFIDNEIENVPMRIFVSQSKSHYLNAKELFRTIQAGLTYFEDFFGIKFPFSKYDQIFCPDLRVLGMENVGAVALNENEFLVPHEEMTENKRFTLAFTALKELAHMWFGNLVGMKWWSDLWLKQSFAVYMAASCMIESKEFESYANTDQIFVKLLFNAVNSDIKSTTHPIQAPVKHTIDAENVFDSISFDKGASYIKMMNNFVGRDAFKFGLKEYFAKYKFQNTELKDFINCLQMGSARTGSNQEIRLWAHNWLTKSGINQVIPVIEKNLDKGTYTLSIKQTSSQFGDPILKEQIIDIALYDNNGNERIIKNIRLRQMEITPNVLEGRLDEFPAAILLNANNKGYCRVILDHQSQQFFLNNLSMIQSKVNRGYIWKKLFDQVRNKLLQPQDYLECLFTHFLNEDSEVMIPMILAETNHILNLYFTHFERKHLQLRYQKCLINKMSETTSLSQKSLLATAVLDDTICVERDYDLILSWLDLGRIVNAQNNSVACILSSSHRYQILRHIQKSHKMTELEKERRMNYELMQGGNVLNESQLNHKIILDAVLPYPSNKEKLWNEYVNGNMNMKELKLSTKYFYDHDDEAICLQYGNKFFDVIEKIFADRYRDYAEIFFKNLSPSFLGREAYLDNLIKILERATKTDNTHFINLLKEEIELLEEIIEIRSLQKVTI
eukprot:403372348